MQKGNFLEAGACPGQGARGLWWSQVQAVGGSGGPPAVEIPTIKPTKSRSAFYPQAPAILSNIK